MFATVYSALFSRMFCLLHGIQRCAFLSDTMYITTDKQFILLCS